MWSQTKGVYSHIKTSSCICLKEAKIALHIFYGCFSFKHLMTWFSTAAQKHYCFPLYVSRGGGGRARFPPLLWPCMWAGHLCFWPEFICATAANSLGPVSSAVHGPTQRGGSLLACHEKLVCLPLLICSGLRPRQQQKEALLSLLPVRCRDQLEHGEQQEN